MNLDQALRWLDSHINLEAGTPRAGSVGELSLDRMQGLLNMLGAPQLDVPVIHITGTNGKGSTAHLLSRILIAHGLSVGTYGSPHIDALNERIKHDDAPISDEDFTTVLNDLRLAADHLDAAPSWFELVTAAAYRWFNDIAVEAGVIEVGMLGRYDATNVADTQVAIVTNVAKDHTDGAEGWKEAIAAEKAGIIRAGAPLVLGETNPELLPIWEAEEPSPTYLRDRDFGVSRNELAIGGRLIDLRTPRSTYDELFVSLHGRHQGDNAALAVVAAELFLDAELDREHLDEALATAVMPARFEVLGREPLVIVDGAHNAAGAASSIATLDEGFHVFGQRILIVGMMREKSPEEMLAALSIGDADLVVVCEPSWTRAMPVEQLAEAARSTGASVEVARKPADALERALALSTEADLILASGSLYVAAEVRSTYQGLAA